MKSLIALVVAIGLVSVEGTSIIRHVMSKDLGSTKDHDYMTIDGRNAMLTGLIRNKLLNIGTLENVYLEKKVVPSFKCTNATCEFCEYGFCLSVIYDSKSDQFGVTGTFIGGYIFSSSIHVRPWHDCETINTLLVPVEACVTISKVKIMNGRVCADIRADAGHLFSKTFEDMCI